ncbi:hypothetical protein [Actinacidiphila paucisporea]|uniref:hypothetical protein n=1 Tax=Actinacidiphila paucisporea TaxID=310782 RepID=UPI0011613269|nr:hypothetical protein [Actinacidiphila paucisporea]
MKIVRTVVAVATGIAAITLAACGPAGVSDAGGAPTTSTVTATTPPASASASISPSASPTPPPPSPSPTAARRTSAPHTTKPKAPVRHTTARPVHRTTPPARKAAVCSIRSNAGNCYTAGQFCRKADLGATTTDAKGRSITCVMESGRPHWHY